MSCGGRKRCVAHRVASSHDGKHMSRQSAADTTTDLSSPPSRPLRRPAIGRAPGLSSRMKKSFMLLNSWRGFLTMLMSRL